MPVMGHAESPYDFYVRVDADKQMGIDICDR